MLLEWLLASSLWWTKTPTMNLLLVGRSAAVMGRRVTVTPEKPFVISTKTTNRSGRVTIAYVDGNFHLTNSSPMRCVINGKEIQQTRLSDSDKIEIGKDSFVVTIVMENTTDNEAGKNKEVKRNDSNLYEPMVIELRDDGPDEPKQNEPKLDVLKMAEQTANDLSSAPAAPAQFDEDAETAEHPRGKSTSERESARASHDSDRYRQSRRISASRLAAIDPAPKQGLLSKVTKVFQRKDEREQKLALLESQRKALLVEAGRHALGPGGSIGLPDSMVKSLLSGGSVTIRPNDLLPADLERWRFQRQQMILLDAEIAALRRALGLGQDPRQHNEQAPPSRADQRALQERAFARMDGTATDELLPQPANDAPDSVADNAKKSQSSNRLRPIPRHRR
jgi:hypothetical protein